jgi:carboxymethylenebutenolidase
VIQEWWGLVPHIQTICDRFAAAGLTALAPDLYHGESAAAPDDARKLMMSLNIEEASADLGGAIDFLLSQVSASGNHVGVVGFCMGGMLSLFAACGNPKVGACVDFYGVHPNVKPNLESLSAPVLGFFGAKDHVVPRESVTELENRLRSLNKAVEFVIYEEADHAFFNDTRADVYNPRAATDAWNRMLSFYRHHLS